MADIDGWMHEQLWVEIKIVCRTTRLTLRRIKGKHTIPPTILQDSWLNNFTVGCMTRTGFVVCFTANPRPSYRAVQYVEHPARCTIKPQSLLLGETRKLDCIEIIWKPLISCTCKSFIDYRTCIRLSYMLH